jgi:hypothetical protein
MRRHVELGVRAGINRAHIDNHKFVSMCDEFLEIYLEVGRDRGIPCFMSRDSGNPSAPPEWFRSRRQKWENCGQPVFDHSRVVTRRGDVGWHQGCRVTKVGYSTWSRIQHSQRCPQ